MRRSRGRAEGAFPEPCLPWGSPSWAGSEQSLGVLQQPELPRHRDPCPAPKCHHGGASSDRNGIHEVGIGIDWVAFMESADSCEMQIPWQLC